MSANRGQKSSKPRNNRRRRPRNRVGGQSAAKCPVCGQSVRDVLTAICAEDGQSPAHFDCILKEIGKNESLANREKVCYLGKGCFGIVRFEGGANSTRFSIRKRIQYEPKDMNLEWRKTVAGRLPVDRLLN